MRTYSGQVHNRRELFAGALRYATLGLLTAGGAAALARRQKFVPEGKCTNRGTCNHCKVFKQCGLPQALSARQILQGVDDGRR